MKVLLLLCDVRGRVESLKFSRRRVGGASEGEIFILNGNMSEWMKE